MKSLRSLHWASGSLSNTRNGNGICLVCRRRSSSGSHAATATGVSLKSGDHKRSRKTSLVSKDRDSTLPDRFRAVMRQMPHPVVIITTLDCPPPPPPPPTTTTTTTKASEPFFDPGAVPRHWTRSDILDSSVPSRSSEIDKIKQQQQSLNDLSFRPLRPIPRAMTVSSFTSLSLRPLERVLFNIALPSRTYHAIRSSRRFNAHVLASDEHGARLADLFTKGYGLGAGADTASDGGSGHSTGLGILAGLDEYGVEVQNKSEWDAEWKHVVSSSGGGDDGGRKPVRTDISAPLLRGKGILHVLKCDLYAPLYPNDGPLSSPPRSDNDDSDRLLGYRGDDHPHVEHDNFAIMLGRVTDIVHGDGEGVAEGGDGDIALAYADGAYRMPGKQVLKNTVVTPKR